MKYSDELAKSVMDAMTEATKFGYQNAQIMSQGTESLGQLRAADHPYARRHGLPLRDPAIINEQTGDFLRSWINPAPERNGDVVEGSIENDNWVADYLTQKPGRMGKYRSKMFKRPIDDEVEAITKTALETSLVKHLQKFADTDIEI